MVLEQHLEKMRLEPGRMSASQRAAPGAKQVGLGWGRPRATWADGALGLLVLTGGPAGEHTQQQRQAELHPGGGADWLCPLS